MTYKGYAATLEIDEEAGELFGRVQGTRHIITFQGETIEEARRSFEETIDAYLESCRESGEEPDRPFSGKFVVRIAPDLHRELARIADRRGASLNEVVGDALAVSVQMDKSAGLPVVTIEDCKPMAEVMAERAERAEAERARRRGKRV
jgi:predicted HicB family RNase H-like nuclease